MVLRRRSRMKVLGALLAGTLALAASHGVAEANVTIRVDKTAQRMTVEVDGKTVHNWAVSTARSGYTTPSGSYRPIRMHRMWYSQKYDLSPMPNAIFFSGGYAIHGTGAVGQLGRPASHGCVRLAPGNAATLYALVQSHGMGATRIQLHGNPRHQEPAIARAKTNTRLVQRPQTVRQSGYQLASAPIVSAYDPRFYASGAYRQVRYLAPAAGYGGSGAYVVRTR